jgi:hypothetical protein
MSEPIKQISELETMALRDIVYESVSTQENWDRCRDNWLKPENVKWLQDEYAKTKGRP